MRFENYLKEFKGSFLKNKKMPKEGESVYALIGFDKKIVKGNVERISNIDKKGLENTYMDLNVDGKIYHVDINQIYDHKPKKNIVKDEYGKVEIWE